MRLTPKKTEEILIGILGEDGTPLIKELMGKENVSEFDLASRTNKDIKIIRKMLYILYNFNLVGFNRKKDKLKGWYIYYWTLLPDNVKYVYLKRKKELLDKLKQRLEDEGKEIFFTCQNKCVRLNFDQAMDIEFHCPECGELLSQEDSQIKQEELQQRIHNIEEELEKARLEKKEKKVKGKERKKVIKEKIKRKSTVKKAVKKVTEKLKKVVKKNN